MTYTDENGMTWIQEELPKGCGDCGVVAETRPYGPGGIEVCYPCMMKDEEDAKKRFLRQIEGK